jgi:hypothetical protein
MNSVVHHKCAGGSLVLTSSLLDSLAPKALIGDYWDIQQKTRLSLFRKPEAMKLVKMEKLQGKSGRF